MVKMRNTLYKSLTLFPMQVIIFATVLACVFKKAGTRELASKGMVVPNCPEKQVDVGMNIMLIYSVYRL